MHVAMEKVLIFGLTTLDIINVCERFPEEDEDVRVSQQYWQKGGNAANTSQVLAQQDIEVHLFSAFAADNAMSAFTRSSLEESNVITKHCAVFQSCGFPTSCCIVAKNTGSRTIMHGRNGLPELKLKNFEVIDLSQYSWVHFEGRGFPHLKEIVLHTSRVREDKNLKFKISVEFEKPKRYNDLISSGIAELADILFISKEFSSHLGFTSAQETVENIKRILRLNHNVSIICPWGDQGADAVDENGLFFHSDCFPPGILQDTLGAGDTFIAGILSSLIKGLPLQDAIIFGCQIAGKKCGQFGFKNLKM